MRKIQEFHGIVKIDGSLFGRKIKYKGNPQKSKKVWIVGLMERKSNKLILYPVKDRSAETLENIIIKHVRPGSTIYTDGWRGYGKLKQFNYTHFVVNHRNIFKAKYENSDTGDILSVHTNKIERAWQHVKNTFGKCNLFHRLFQCLSLNCQLFPEVC